MSGIHAVHDVTVAYPYNIPTGEMDLLQGEVPREVHFNIKRYSIHEVMNDYRSCVFIHFVGRDWLLRGRAVPVLAISQRHN